MKSEEEVSSNEEYVYHEKAPSSSKEPVKEEKKKKKVKEKKKNKKDEKKEVMEEEMKEVKEEKRTSIELPEEEEKEESGQQKLKRIFEELESSAEGLSTSEAEKRLSQFGPNSLPEHKDNPVLKFLSFMWGPLAWSMEFAAILSFILNDFIDGALIVALLFGNASIGYYEEHSSGNAIAALKKQLCPTSKCMRDGKINRDIESQSLVPGDVVLLRLGDVIPADCYLLEGEGLKVDQSSLTGESLPVNKFTGDEIYSGAIVKQGEMHAIVHATGINTFFGKAAHLVESAGNVTGHFQLVLRSIGWFCIGFIILFVVVELIVQFGIRRAPCTGIKEGECQALLNILVLVVGGIPIAMPTVLSVTMAIGAAQLAKKKAIVSRLTAVEELAGMDILCSDKTGTLTKNELTLAAPYTYGGVAKEDAKFYAALASRPENDDAIDIAIVEDLPEDKKEYRKAHTVLYYHPFDPVSKKSFAKVKSPEGKIFHCSKGAPQVILNESANADKLREKVTEHTNILAKRGYRALGVSIGDETGTVWNMVGLIPLFDPPRDDTAYTIEKVKAKGCKVKMITGDQIAIAKETASMLGMGQTIFKTEVVDKSFYEGMPVEELIENADGFAEVFPEHKYLIVKKLQERNHIVGMTGDGVNDAPALKKADIGIAVADATDAARAAADIVLLSPGLGVIVDAMIGSRKIFQRMKNYCMYSVAAAVRIVLTFGILTIAYDWYFPTIGIVFLAILNDGTMLTISKDRVRPSETPDKWNLKEIFSIAVALGLYNTISTIILFVVARETSFFTNIGLPYLSLSEIRGLIYLQVSISGLATIFVTRSQSFFFLERPGALMSIAFVFAQVVASILGAYGLGGYPNETVTNLGHSSNFDGSGWGYVLVAWIWCIIWFIPMDFIKFYARSLSKGDINPFHEKPLVFGKLTFGHPYFGQHPEIEKNKSRVTSISRFSVDMRAPSVDRSSINVNRPGINVSRSNSVEIRALTKRPSADRNVGDSAV